MRIGLVNQSSLVSQHDFQTMASAIRLQADQDLCPTWARMIPNIALYNTVAAVPPQTWPIVLMDTIQDEPEGVLGYHTEDEGGKLSGIVAAKPSLDVGAKVLTGDWSVCSVLSHEVCEMIVDPNCQLWASDGGQRMHSYEVCDAVEGPTYTKTDCSVANFVTPAWFDPMAAPHAKFDFMGKLAKPFSLLDTGYVVYMTAGSTHEIQGNRMPMWRRDHKSHVASRASKYYAHSLEKD
jgi:hypothetical protein